ncbi:MAG TPA: DUF2905 domain-containing protein [Steroidobacteraceae bacterium]|nr:DUF2905 domain-containing protein [Steroidobacteraceae bacterium]
MSRILIVIGLVIALIGVGWPWLSKLPFGRLPGDIRIERPGFSFYFPLMTSIIISAVVSLVMWLTRRK